MLAKRLTWDSVKPRFMAVYDETFSKQQLNDIVKFFNTPSGQSLNRKMPALNVRCLQVAQEAMGDTTDEIQAFIAKFQRDIKEIHEARSAGRANAPNE
jgi:hypothetical protein